MAISEMANPGVRPLDRVLDALRARGHVLQLRGGQWRCTCPAHDDRHPSLSLAERDGTVLVRCHAGCSPEAVVASLGLTMADLFPQSPRRADGAHRAREGRVIQTYPYRGEDDQLLYEVVRLDSKRFYQRRPDPAGPGKWIKNLDGVRRVPYRLPELLAAPADRPVYLPEGEKDVDSLVRLDLVATTNPMGAGKWGVLDRVTVERAFRGRHVFILPDNDQAGGQHAEEVAAALAGVAAEVRVVVLPNLPHKGDVSDWLAAGRMVDRLEELAAAAPVWQPGTTEKPEGDPVLPRGGTQFTPFPVHTLPDPLCRFVREAAAAIGCDEANVALPVLAAAAAAIGNTRQVQLKRGWTEPAIVWVAVVGASGSRKSPPFRAAMRPLVEAEQEFREQFPDAMARYASLPPAEREQAPAPALRRVLTEDVTIESVATILAENPRGVINARDEIDDWFQALTRYKGKAGGTDRSRWLKLSNAETLTVDRKTGEPHLRRLFVPLASCSISGTIQPGNLAHALDRLAMASGLAARLLLAMPPARKAYWSYAEIDPDTHARYAAVIRTLLELTMTADAKGRPTPHVVDLAPEGKAVWVEFYNAIQDQKADAEPDMAAVLAKLEGYAARFALIFHVVTEVAAGRDALAPVGAESVRAGAELARWFAVEARRIYAVLAETDDQRTNRELADWVRSRGGRCTARDLQRARGGSYATAGAAEAALDALVAAGLGTWSEEPNPRGGWPKKEFALYAGTDADTCDTRTGTGECGDEDPSDSRIDTRHPAPQRHRETDPSVASVGVGDEGQRHSSCADGPSAAGPDPDPSVGPDQVLDIEGEL